MRIKFNTIFTLLAVAAFAIAGFAQGVKPSALTGDVVSVSDSKIVLKTKDGELDVALSGATEFKRVPPENPTLKGAVPAALADIGVGDKLLVTGILSEDKRSLPARAVYLMTKSDIARKQAKEVERWATALGAHVSVDLRIDGERPLAPAAERRLTGRRGTGRRHLPADGIEVGAAERGDEAHVGELRLVTVRQAGRLRTGAHDPQPLVDDEHHDAGAVGEERLEGRRVQQRPGGARARSRPVRRVSHGARTRSRHRARCGSSRGHPRRAACRAAS